MDRNMGRRQGPSVSMSPGMQRRPGAGVPPPRELHQAQNHSQYQSQANSSASVSNAGNPSAPTSSGNVVNHQLQQQQQSPHQHNHQQLQPIQHSQHDELIRYINEAWHSITTDKNQKPPVFYKSVPEPRLSGFIPFDLEAWWGQRLVHQFNISSHGHQ